MQSPFPGMDPYLEKHWRDVHHRLVIYSCDQLQEQLPNDLRARVEERVYFEPEEGDGRSMYPDVRVIEKRTPSPSSTGVLERAIVAGPLEIEAGDEPVTEGYIEIIDVGTGRRVVTVIEFLSLSNKLSGDGQDDYRKKQRELIAGDVNLVEIDLLRAGKRITAVRQSKIPRSHRTTYHICVRRSTRKSKAEVYRAPLRERLPAIMIPLRPTDADVPLDLQILVEQCYRNGRYDDLDYKSDPIPPLDPDDARWAVELLRAKGLRG